MMINIYPASIIDLALTIALLYLIFRLRRS